VSDRTCLAVMYHYVRDTTATPFPEIRALPPAMFEQQLDWLQAGYALIDQPRLDAALRDRHLPPDAALLTFDDGVIDHYQTVLPLLRARGVSGTFFLSHDACSDSPRMLPVHKVHFLLARMGAEAFGRAVLDACGLGSHGAAGRQVLGADRWEDADVRAVKHLVSHELPFDEADRVLEALFAEQIGDSRAFARQLYLNPGMVREMARAGMTFGYHTRSHRMLARLAPEEQRQELEAGVAWIRDLTGQSAVPFCYPWGGPRTYTRETLRILRDTGYSCAFNTVRRRLQADDNPFELPRVDTRDLPPYTAAEPAPAPAYSAEDA
jgi:peptidoglycan/xylan/chitin deacetylase (PgdA/CDA1 family)